MQDIYYEPCGYVDLSTKLAFECKTDPRVGVSTGIPTLKKQPDEDIVHYMYRILWKYKSHKLSSETNEYVCIPVGDYQEIIYGFDELLQEFIESDYDNNDNIYTETLNETLKSENTYIGVKGTI